MFDILFVMIFGLSGRVLTKGKFKKIRIIFKHLRHSFIFHVVQIRTLFHSTERMNSLGMRVDVSVWHSSVPAHHY